MDENKDLLNYFIDGVTFRYDATTAVLAIRTAGELVLTSGNIVSCDPTDTVGISDFKPLFPAVPAGTYPVDIAVATLTEDSGASNTLVAASRVRFSDAEAVRWIPAMLEEEQGKPITEGDVRGYAIESGISSYFDADAIPYLDGHGDEWFENVNEIMENIPEGTLKATATPIGNTGLNTVMFESGMGDGTYGSYWGYDANGTIVALATDFDLFHDMNPVNA